MFEGTLVESRPFAVTPGKRWTTAGSVLVQCGLASLLVALPLLHPEALPMLTDAPRLVLPLPMKPPPVLRVTAASAAPASSPATPAAIAPALATARFTFPRRQAGPDQVSAPDLVPGLHMGAGDTGVLSALAAGPATSGVAVVRAPPAGPVRVSSGVSSGMLLSEIRPVYPAIARAARIEGAVVMEATISKSGRIESLRALSGPEMLRGAALAAVQTAHYQPYRLNGEPTEVQTTITINFRLGS